MSMMTMVMSTMMTVEGRFKIAEGLTLCLEELPTVSSFPEQRLFAPRSCCCCICPSHNNKIWFFHSLPNIVFFWPPESVLLWPGKAMADTSTVEEIQIRPDRTSEDGGDDDDDDVDDDDDIDDQ